MKITIITVSFNNKSTIKETIESVFSQNYSNIEYIIIDGNSQDGTQEIIKQYNKIVFISEQDNGIYDAMNKGIKLATGKYIQFLGADDRLIDSNVISTIVKELNENVDILSTGIFMVDEKLRLKKYGGNLIARDKEKYDGSMIPHPGFFVKTTLMKKFLFDEKYKIAADYKFFLECYLNKDIKFKFIDIATVYFSLTGISSRGEEGINEHIAIMKRFNLPLKMIKKVEKNRYYKNKSSWKSKIKEILSKNGFLSWILRLKGWEKY